MSSDFMPSSPKIDEIVAAHTTGQGVDFERMKEALKGHMADTNPPVAPAPRPILSGPEPRATHLRVVYPHLNTRVELLGSSEADLDAQEQRLREFYGGTR